MNFSEVTDEDIENITEIDLRVIKFNGEETDVILAELDAFPNLNGLLISHFDLKEEDIDAISRQDKLRVVQFSSCDFENIETINLPNLDVLVFVGCTDMGKLKMPKSRVLRVIGSELNFDGVDVNNIEKLLIQNSLVNNFTSLDSKDNLIEVNLDGSTLYDKDGNLVKDVKVKPEISFSYEDEFLPEDR